ncbi:MAG: GNAT family N-acetyltransferase [Ignavibacterium sp.]|jgi:GNAT superfamily N-acetyltransferase
MAIQVRQATLEDAPLIAQYNAFMALETENRVLDQETLRKGVESVLADPSAGLYYLAEIDGRVAGQLMVTYEWSDWRNGMFWWIQSVYVREEYRKKGVFKALYRFVESQARSKPDVCGLRLYVEHENARAKHIYEKLGMKKTPYELYELDFVLGKESR